VDTVNKVYVANFAGHDHSEASAWGELVMVTIGFVNYESLDRLKFRITEELKEYKEDDWLLLSGTNIINVFCAVIIYHKHQKVKILSYNKNKREYKEVILSEQSLGQIVSVLEEE